MSGPEWYVDVLVARYGADWHQLRAPKVAMFIESMYRDDGWFPVRQVQSLADFYYFPAIQDAREFGGQWLPYGVDVTVFNPKPVEKRHQAAFLGTLYQKRVDFLRSIPYRLEILSPVSHEDPRRSFELLAEAYSAIRIFVNAPALSRVLVGKVTEILACRTFLLTPAIDHPSGTANMTLFESGKHLVYYDPSRPGDVPALIAHYLAHPDEADAIAEAGWREVTRAHTLSQRMEQVIKDVRAAHQGR
jgi:glycosyltransferase involved in cell wall biosynthesis